MPNLFASTIRTCKWKRFFQGVNAIRLGVVYINEEEYYAKVKG